MLRNHARHVYQVPPIDMVSLTPWVFTLVFDFIGYAVGSPASAIIPELEASFHTTALAVGVILGIYYFRSLVTEVALTILQLKCLHLRKRAEVG